MKFQLEHSLRDYISFGDGTTKDIINSDTPLWPAIEEYYGFFQHTLWAADSVEMSPHQAFLSMHAFMTWTAAVRVAISGHSSVTFPLFRTALEAACYAYLMKENEDLAEIWSKRNSSPQALKLSRRKFTSAVSDAAKKIGEISRPEIETWITDAYDGAIDYGAHPNPKSIYTHLNPPQDKGDFYLVSLTGIYDAAHQNTQRSLLACLDFGIVIALVLAHGLKHVTEEINIELERLNQLKEKISVEHFGMPPLATSI